MNKHLRDVRLTAAATALVLLFAIAAGTVLGAGEDDLQNPCEKAFNAVVGFATFLYEDQPAVKYALICSFVIQYEYCLRYIDVGRL